MSNRIKQFHDFILHREHEKSISGFLNSHVVGRWKINEDGSVDVDGNLDLSDGKVKLEELHIAFNRVTGYYICEGCSY